MLATGGDAPTGILEESGFVVYADGTVDYWAIRDSDGVFAVGSDELGADDGGIGAPVPPFCGLGMIQGFWFSLLGLLLLPASSIFNGGKRS